MKLDPKLNKLPLTKSNPTALTALFGKPNMTPMWVADMNFTIAKPIQEALRERILNSGFGYEYKPNSFFEAQKSWYKNIIRLNSPKKRFYTALLSQLQFLFSLKILLQKTMASFYSRRFLWNLEK